MIKQVLLLIFFSVAITSYSQIVFTYGKKSVTKSEFLKAFNKNPNLLANRKNALKDYLDLYINYKLKVQAAYDEKLHELPSQESELENFQQQVAENILNDEARIDDLVKEAFQRSLKDVLLAQVFIEVAAGSDTSIAYQSIQNAYKALNAGKEFTSVAKEYSNDPSTQQSGGDLGYITVFSLPYEFENVAYNLKRGNYSAPFKSRLGYHIFKNLEERRGVGTRTVSQILFALPPTAGSEQIQSVARIADSVYNLIQAGTSFEELVKIFSNDLNTVNNQGLLPEISVGQYSATFEKAAYLLTRPGEISKPFLTNYGYHILKLQEVKPVGSDINDAMAISYLKDKIVKEDRLAKAKKAVSKNQLALIKYKQAPYSEKELWRFTDSALQNGVVPVTQVTGKTILFTFEKQKITVEDWVRFVKAIRQTSSPLSKMDYKPLMQEFVMTTGTEYYRRHLKDYSPVYRQQVLEFKEANMLFGIMDVKVWNFANNDTLGLSDYYEKNRAKYLWKPSAEALIILCPNEDVVRDVKQKIAPDFSNWRTVVNAYNGSVTADSGRYELGQLPVVDKTEFKPGVVTLPARNDADGTYTFNYIIKVYNDSEQRSFEDARGMVISDYQQVLEDKWLAQLKKKYPVKINTAVFNSIK